MTKLKKFTCEVFRPSGLHQAKFVMLLRVRMSTTESCWERNGGRKERGRERGSRT